MIKLYSDEKRLFDILLKAAPEGTVLRVAGGWVRDKILGHDSNDIDIAVNNMSGLQLATIISNKLGIKNISILEARPDQSKHLETAILKIDGISIDFTNLRKENYSNSRIPTIEPGTPKEDAFRRDLTINALFYNLNTKIVEDFTGFGLYDLEHKIARTPIEAYQTFMDDGLRILRIIKFASRFGLEIVSEITRAANHSDVQKAFKTKISRERIWSEMIGVDSTDGWKRGFLIGPDPIYALQLVELFGFRDILFRPYESNLNPWDTDQNSSYHDLNIWDHSALSFRHLINFFTGYDIKENQPENYGIRNLAMILHDIGKCDVCYRQLHSDGIHYQYKEHEIGSAKHSEIVLEQLNAPIEVRQRVIRLVREHMRLHVLPDNPSDKALRRFLRDLGEDWEHSVDLAIADACGKLSVGENIGDIMIRYERFRAHMKQLLKKQQGQTTVKRPINGYDLMELGIKSGPIMGELFKQLDEQLLETPDMTKETAIEFVNHLINQTTINIINATQN